MSRWTWVIPTSMVELGALALAWPLERWRFWTIVGLWTLGNFGRRMQVARRSSQSRGDSDG